MFCQNIYTHFDKHINLQFDIVLIFITPTSNTDSDNPFLLRTIFTICSRLIIKFPASYVHFRRHNPKSEYVSKSAK